jgi:hypothetical protein
MRATIWLAIAAGSEESCKREYGAPPAKAALSGGEKKRGAARENGRHRLIHHVRSAACRATPRNNGETVADRERHRARRAAMTRALPSEFQIARVSGTPTRPRAIITAATRSGMVQRRQSFTKSCIATHPPAGAAQRPPRLQLVDVRDYSARGLMPSPCRAARKFDRCAFCRSPVEQRVRRHAFSCGEKPRACDNVGCRRRRREQITPPGARARRRRWRRWWCAP